MQSIGKDDMRILAHLRADSRVNLTKISKKTMMPISTIFDRMKKYNKDIITKSTILVDFKRLGYELKVNILIKTTQEKREDIRNFADKNLNVNSVYRINNGFDFMIEALFKNMLELEDFNDKLEAIGLVEKQEYYILEEIKREEFISHPELVELV